MSSEVQIAIISSMSALLGGLLGGLITTISTLRIKKQEWEQNNIDKSVEHRKLLYSDFLEESSSLALRSIDSKVSKADEFSRLYSLLSRILLISNDRVVEHAKIVVHNTIHLHAKDNEKLDQSVAKKNFIDACRAEINDILSGKQNIAF